MTRVITDIGDVGEWLATVTTIWFLIQYSLLAKWWANFVGRSIVILDACLLALLIPSVLILAKPHWAPFFASVWFLCVEVLLIFGISFVMISRLVGFSRIAKTRERMEIPDVFTPPSGPASYSRRDRPDLG